MRQRLSTLALIVGVAIALMGSNCTPPPPNLSPQATTAFYGTRVIQTLDVVRDLVVSANKQTPPVVATADMLKIVTWHRSALVIVHTAPAGWKAAVQAGLAETVKDLPPPEQALLAPYVALVNTVLAEVE